MDKKEFKEIWNICPTGKGKFWSEHHNRYLPKTLDKWFNEHLDQLIKLEIGCYLQEKLNDYDVGSLEYKIIEAWIKAIREE